MYNNLTTAMVVVSLHQRQLLSLVSLRAIHHTGTRSYIRRYYNNYRCINRQMNNKSNNATNDATVRVNANSNTIGTTTITTTTTTARSAAIVGHGDDSDSALRTTTHYKLLTNLVKPIEPFRENIPLPSTTSATITTTKTVKPSTVDATAATTTNTANVGRIIPLRRIYRGKNVSPIPLPPKVSTKLNSSTSNSSSTSNMQLIRVGLPFIFFSILASWVVSNAYGGKLKELEVSQGKSSISIRQAALQAEHDAMMEKLQKIIKDDNFDNTKRIKRPEEVLEERRLERQKRNVWYRRWYRAITGDTSSTTKSQQQGKSP